MQKKKTEIVTMRMTPKVKAQLQERARNANLTLTDYLCICGLGKEIVRVDGLDKLLSELKAQGRNLNQLTTLANMGRITVLRGDDLMDGYVKLCGQIAQLTKEINGGPAKAAPSFCGERRHPGMNEHSADKAECK